MATCQKSSGGIWNLKAQHAVIARLHRSYLLLLVLVFLIELKWSN